MMQGRLLLVHENVRGARFIQHLLEEAGYAVEWRPCLTPTLLRSGAIPDAVVFDLHFLDQEDQAILRSMCEHPRWKAVPVPVTAAVLPRKARLLLSRIGADDVMLRPVRPADGKELLVRPNALFSNTEQERTVPLPALAPDGQQSKQRTSLADIATLASLGVSPRDAEAILVQLLRTFRRTVPFDVGFVCAETEPNRYMVVAHLGDDSFETARWYEPGMSYTGWIALHKQALVIPDIEREPRVRMVGRELGTNRNLQSFIGVPLMYEGHVVGTMEAACYKSGALGVRSAVALQHTAEVASLALRRLQALSGTNFAGTSDTRNQSLALGYTQSLSPTLIAEARFGAYRYRVRVEPGGANTMPATQAGIPGLNLGTADTSGMPAFYVNGNGGFNFGYSLPINQCNCPLAETENHFQWVTNWTKIAGNHTIGWGADLRRAQQQRIPSDSHRSGEITFDPSTTGSFEADLAGQNTGQTTGAGMASLLLGVSGAFARYFTGSGLHPGLRQTQLFFYAQDNWRATPRLTLSYGLRYENYLPQNAASPGGAGSFDPATGEVLVAGVGSVSKSMNVTAYKTGFIPRLGVAYQIQPKTVLRADYGSSFTPAGLGAVFGQAPYYDPPIILPQQLNADTSYGSVYDLYTGPPVPTLPAVAATGRYPLPNNISVYYFFDPPNRYRVPLTEFWNAAIQHQITPSISIEAAYVGSVGRHIFVNANLNQAAPGPGNFNSRERFYQLFGLTQGVYRTCNCDNSNYHALQMKWVEHQARGLDFIVAYSYSKALDDMELGGVADNNLNYKADYGPASFDRRHQLSISNVWILPFGHGQRFGANVSRLTDLVAGGWEFSGISTATSGVPFTPNVSNAPLLNANFNSVRPDKIGNPHVANPNRTEWFNPAAFTAPQGLYRDGNTGRNSLVGPRTFLMNLSLSKVFTITEGKTIQFRWENYNALNHVNLNTPNNLMTSRMRDRSLP